MNYAIITLVLAAVVGSVNGSEMIMNDHGIIIRIDKTEIDYSRVGALKFDLAISLDMKSDIQKAIDEYAVTHKSDYKYRVMLAKQINDCILVVCEQERGGLKVADGGLDVVYSVISKKIVGVFHGGERG